MPEQVGPILGREAKRSTLHELRDTHNLADHETLAVGDGANDLAMLGDAGLGVAFRAKPAVAEAAHARVEHADLTALLYAQGFKREEFVTEPKARADKASGTVYQCRTLSKSNWSSGSVARKPNGDEARFTIPARYQEQCRAAPLLAKSFDPAFHVCRRCHRHLRNLDDHVSRANVFVGCR